MDNDGDNKTTSSAYANIFTGMLPMLHPEGDLAIYIPAQT